MSDENDLSSTKDATMAPPLAEISETLPSITAPKFSEEKSQLLADFADQITRTGSFSNVEVSLLLDLLRDVSQTGLSCYDWSALKLLLAWSLQESLKVFEEAGEDSQKRIQDVVSSISLFDHPPFTFQRICELSLNAEKYYHDIKKFVNAIEKLSRVSSTMDTLSPEEYNARSETAITDLLCRQQQQRDECKREEEQDRLTEMEIG